MVWRWAQSNAHPSPSQTPANRELICAGANIPKLDFRGDKWRNRTTLKATPKSNFRCRVRLVPLSEFARPPLSSVHRFQQPVIAQMGVDQDHHIVRKPRVLDVDELAVARALFRPL